MTSQTSHNDDPHRQPYPTVEPGTSNGYERLVAALAALVAATCAEPLHGDSRRRSPEGGTRCAA